jgi:hypothetical protein
MTESSKYAAFTLFLFAGAPLTADEGGAVAEAARAAFDRMPLVQTVPEIKGRCGADTSVHPAVAYCTSSNVILLAESGGEDAQRDYYLAHAYGHAVQVQHGVADVALRAIRSRPDDEAMLRGYVERQVDCIAGFILQAAGLTLPDLEGMFDRDPLNVPHWGRNPLLRGPHLEVPVSERADWLAQGYAQGLASCAVGEFPADLLVAAHRR